MTPITKYDPKDAACQAMETAFNALIDSLDVLEADAANKYEAAAARAMSRYIMECFYFDAALVTVWNAASEAEVKP